MIVFYLIGCKIGFCEDICEKYTSPDRVPCVDYL